MSKMICFFFSGEVIRSHEWDQILYIIRLGPCLYLRNNLFDLSAYTHNCGKIGAEELLFSIFNSSFMALTLTGSHLQVEGELIKGVSLIGVRSNFTPWNIFLIFVLHEYMEFALLS